MSFPSLEHYASSLPFAPQADTRIWRDAQGRAQGRYFNSTLTSAFQPLFSLVKTRRSMSVPMRPARSKPTATAAGTLRLRRRKRRQAISLKWRALSWRWSAKNSLQRSSTT